MCPRTATARPGRGRGRWCPWALRPERRPRLFPCSPLPGLPGGAHTARVLWAVPQGCGCWRRWGVLEAEWEVWGPDGLRAGDLWLEERVP